MYLHRSIKEKRKARVAEEALAYIISHFSLMWDKSWSVQCL
jgi:hypothetical protein